MGRNEHETFEGSNTILEFEFHLDIQANSSNNVCIKWRMKIQTQQNKPHRKRTSIAQKFMVSFTIIISGVTIVYIGKEFESISDGLKSIHWM